ncbi:MAG: flagellar basal body P-ring protein FlgI [Melioribacteraceae bacterium]|jgi:flagellar P-ring protein precursor FlgI|nr:flagellar basal body P-ring protein FlgI [Melioribacteraceae bacterium]RJP63167.1 MAG: flagellar basal body P-ring protein FlgI [Ignavibacteriales bacterium]WKZ70147.1 MAG: flagellar basal body P-ring protein FlgI [Melioribacteraceae bacterium]
MKSLLKYIALSIIAIQILPAQRIKDIAYVNGDNSTQVIGYAVVVGLGGTGDSHRTSFTIQSISSMLKRFGITVPQDQIKTRNVAAVMVTATISNFLKPGSKFDVNVSSLGDARSLQGGTLLMTPLSDIEGTVYAMAQGPISVGGYELNSPTGNKVGRNHVLAGRVPLGGILQVPLPGSGFNTSALKVYLRSPDITTASNVSTAINQYFSQSIAMAIDPSEIEVQVPADRQQEVISFLSELESIEVATDYTAKVVLNERTGTVVAGSSVKIQPVTISHGGLNIAIRSYPMVSQPGAFSRGEAIFFNNMVPYAQQDSTTAIALNAATNVQEVAAALNTLKVSPKDIIAIFQALKESGALTAELVIM